METSDSQVLDGIESIAKSGIQGKRVRVEEWKW
jgi:hypothetical protein